MVASYKLGVDFLNQWQLPFVGIKQLANSYYYQLPTTIVVLTPTYVGHLSSYLAYNTCQCSLLKIPTYLPTQPNYLLTYSTKVNYQITELINIYT
jgi:hypothetical protein